MLPPLLLLSFSSLASSTPFKNNLIRRAGDFGSIPANDCSSPCEIYFSGLSTTLTVSAPTQTLNVPGAMHPVTVTFTPVTTTTTIQPPTQTVDNSHPEGTPTIQLQAIDLGSVTMYGSSIEDVEMLDGTQMVYTVTSQVQLLTGANPGVTYYHMNPYDLQNNCAFVTIAKLMDMDLHSFLGMVEEMQDVNQGLSTSRIMSILQVIDSSADLEVALGDTLDEIAGRMHHPRQLGVCYLRDDASGHCVVYRNGLFYDYQTSDAPQGTLEDGGEDIEQLLQPRVFDGGMATGVVFAIDEEYTS